LRPSTGSGRKPQLHSTTHGHSNCEHSLQKRPWANIRMVTTLMKNACAPWMRHEQRAGLWRAGTVCKMRG
jgi:hypothetical protein